MRAEYDLANCPKCGTGVTKVQREVAHFGGEIWPTLICVYFTRTCWHCGHTFETRIEAPYQPMEVP